MAAFPEHSTKLLLAVEKVLYLDKRLSFQSQSRAGVHLYRNLFGELEDYYLRPHRDTSQIQPMLDDLCEADDDFLDFMHDRKIDAAYKLLWALQQEWVRRAINFAPHVRERLAFVVKLRNGFPDSLQFINVCRDLSDETRLACVDALDTINALTRSPEDAYTYGARGSLSAIPQELQVFLRASDAFKNINDAATMLCDAKRLSQLGTLVRFGFNVGAIANDHDVVANIILVLLVHRMLDSLVVTEHSKPPPFKKSIYDDVKEDLQLVDAREVPLLITNETTPKSLVSDFLSRARHPETVTSLRVTVRTRDTTCVDALYELVEASPLLTTVKFTFQSTDRFVQMFVEKDPRLECVHVPRVESTVDLRNIRGLAVDADDIVNLKNLQGSQFRFLSNLRIDAEVMDKRVIFPAVRSLRALKRLRIDVSRAENYDLETCLNELSNCENLEDFHWTAEQSPTTNEDVYLALCDFIVRKKNTLRYLTIDTLPSDPGLQEALVWKTIEPLETKLLVLAIGLSTITGSGQNIYKALQKNRELELGRYLQIF